VDLVLCPRSPRGRFPPRFTADKEPGLPTMDIRILIRSRIHPKILIPCQSTLHVPSGKRVCIFLVLASAQRVSSSPPGLAGVADWLVAGRSHVPCLEAGDVRLPAAAKYPDAKAVGSGGIDPLAHGLTPVVGEDLDDRAIQEHAQPQRLV
jgi:hypothetical protein